MPNAVEAKSSIEEAYRTIKQLMFQQKLIPGQKLLYRELIQLLGMSKTPIVNALNRLEQEGFVVSEPNVGYAVKPLDTQEIFDSYEVREALEIKALQNAIKSGTPEQMADLDAKCLAFDLYRPQVYDRKKRMLDCEFHLQIAHMSGNGVLKYLLRRNFEHIILRTKLDNGAHQRIETSAREHRDLLEAIKVRDYSEGVACLVQHIQNDREYLLGCISMELQESRAAISFFKA